MLVDFDLSKTSWTMLRHMVNKPFWHISDLVLASYIFGCVKMSDFMPNNCHLQEVLIFFFHSKKTAAEAHRKLQKVYGDAAISETTCLNNVPTLQRRWFRCWWPSAWRKAKNLRRRWIGGIARWRSMPNARSACLSIRSYPPSHFQAIACVGNDSKARNFGSIWFKAKGRWASFFRLSTRPNSHAAKVMLCIWWDQVGVMYYELLKPKETITEEWYWTQLMRLSRAPCEKRPQYEQRHKKVILQHDNARPHDAKPVKTYLETLKWEVRSHSPYSPAIAPSDYYLFRSMAHGLADQQFRSYEDIEKWLHSWIASKDEHPIDFY